MRAAVSEITDQSNAPDGKSISMPNLSLTSLPHLTRLPSHLFKPSSIRPIRPSMDRRQYPRKRYRRLPIPPCRALPGHLCSRRKSRGASLPSALPRHYWNHISRTALHSLVHGRSESEAGHLYSRCLLNRFAVRRRPTKPFSTAEVKGKPSDPLALLTGH